MKVVSHWRRPKMSIGRSSCFSWTWNENRKKFRETRNRHSRKCRGVFLPERSRAREGREVRRVRAVAKPSC